MKRLFVLAGLAIAMTFAAACNTDDAALWCPGRGVEQHRVERPGPEPRLLTPARVSMSGINGRVSGRWPERAHWDQPLRSRIGLARSVSSTTKANIARSPQRPRNRWP